MHNHIVGFDTRPHDKTNKMACAPSEDSDHPSIRPVWSESLLLHEAWVLGYPLSAQRRLWSDWADAQADRSLGWAQSCCWFCHDAAHILINMDWNKNYMVNSLGINKWLLWAVDFHLLGNCKILPKQSENLFDVGPKFVSSKPSHDVVDSSHFLTLHPGYTTSPILKMCTNYV